MRRFFLIIVLVFCALPIFAQAPGTTPVKVSHETQTLNGKKYYVHIVEQGQTVYSISKEYKVKAYEAVTHVDIHFMHAGDTVWLPCRGQFTEAARELEQQQQKKNEAKPLYDADTTPSYTLVRNNKNIEIPKVRPVGSIIKVGLIMPLHLDKMEEISTTKFDVDQRGKKNYREFEFIEFYEGIWLAIQELKAKGLSIELTVVDVSSNKPDDINRAFEKYSLAESDFIVALLFREMFDRAAELAQQAGVYIVNPMSTRSQIVAANPYVVKTQPSHAAMLEIMVNNIKKDHPKRQIMVLHSGEKSDREDLDSVKAILNRKHDSTYVVYKWSESAKMLAALKNNSEVAIISVYDQGKDNNRIYANNLLNRLSAFKPVKGKSNIAIPILYTLSDWTKDFPDINLDQLSLLYYHTFYTSLYPSDPFLSAYREKFITEPSTPLAAIGHDVMYYICWGLHKRNANFWKEPIAPLPELTQPILLQRTAAGLENIQAQLYYISAFLFIPAR